MVTTDALAEDLRADVLNLVSLWADAYAHKTNEKERWIKMADALDRLVGYSHDKGAVRALKQLDFAMRVASGADYETVTKHLIAAQARLAAYSSEKR